VWPYIDTLFANQHGENQGAFDKGHLEAFADGLGLDQLKFRTCLDTNRYRAAVLRETQAGRDLGVQSTPTFFLNGKLIPGVLAFEDFQRLIETALGSGA